MIKIIAEAGVNHNGDINIAKQLIDVAADAGVDYVKFQTFKAEDLVDKAADKASYQKVNTGSEVSQYQMLKNLELSQEDHYILIDYCKEKGVKFFSTAFDSGSLAFLHSLDLGLWKIPSGEITNKPYLEAIAEFHQEIILSTGMCNMKEVEEALEVLYSNGIQRDQLTLLHCTTEYPAPIDEVNLSAMQTMHHHFGVKVGYSDHTQGITIPLAAVAMGAQLIEKHFTLDKQMEGPDHKASLEPDELKAMVQGIRKVERAIGTGAKEVAKSEEKNRSVARKSIHIKTSLPKGTCLTSDVLIMKRPGDGISPMKYKDVIGRELLVDCSSGTKLNWEDIK